MLVTVKGEMKQIRKVQLPDGMIMLSKALESLVMESLLLDEWSSPESKTRDDQLRGIPCQSYISKGI